MADGGAQPRASGEFSRRSFDPEDQTCAVPRLSPISSGTLRYTFSDVELYASTEGHSGTQLRAALTLEDTGPGACAARYAVVGLWPEVRCASDADCREGSGVHPEFFDEVSCNPDIGACMLEGEDFARLPGDD